MSEESDYKESSNGEPVVNRFQRIKKEYIQWSSARYIQRKNTFFILTMQGIMFSHMACVDENKIANNQISKGD